MNAQHIAERIGSLGPLDKVGEPIQRGVRTVVQDSPVGGVLGGRALRPMATDLSAGFLTGASVLDAVGGKRVARVTDVLVVLGVVSAVPTAAAALANWSAMDERARRSALIHAGCTMASTVLYASSFMARRKGHRAKGIALGVTGGAVATAGRVLGGAPSRGDHPAHTASGSPRTSA